MSINIASSAWVEKSFEMGTYDRYNLLLDLLRKRHDFHEYGKVYLTPISYYHL